MAALLVSLAAVAGAALLASPSPVRLGRHVSLRLRLAGAAAAIPIAEMPPMLRAAVVATEDERFYGHHGIDAIGILRALPYDIVRLSFAQGASTITEQLAKALYLGGNDHTLWRKLEDAAVAVKLESRYSKDTILAAYLNSAYFGEGAYGVEAASTRYFGVPARRLDTAQGSLLAGLIQAPSLYDPFRHPSSARARQIEVMRSLVRDGVLSTSAAAAVLARPLPLRAHARLPGLPGVELDPGPTFVWWELALGAAACLLGTAVVWASRGAPHRSLRRLYVLRVAAALSLVAGSLIVVRAFRTS